MALAAPSPRRPLQDRRFAPQVLGGDRAVAFADIAGRLAHRHDATASA
jgi:hypothetical protein